MKSPEQARLIEAERLGNFVPAPSDIDPMFVVTKPFIQNVFIDPQRALSELISVDRFAEAAPDFIAGFTSVAENASPRQGIQLMNTVMIFPDEQKAAAAAAALQRINFEVNNQNEPVQIPKYPAAHAHWRPHVQSIGSWLATGKLVVLTLIVDYGKAFLEVVDQPALIRLVERSLDSIVPSVSKFIPTPADKLMNAQIDMDGMLFRTLPRPTNDSWVNVPGAYQGPAALHFTNEPARVRKLMEEAGVDRYSEAGAMLYRARDTAAAMKLQSDGGGLSKKYRTADSPRNLPIAKCREYIGKDPLIRRYSCSVSHGRYAAFVYASQLLDAQQRISAQYALLVNAG